jgi:Transposase DDE domain
MVRPSCPLHNELSPEGPNQIGGVSAVHSSDELTSNEGSVVLAFRKKMETEEAQSGYRRCGRVVEFCHAWIKSKLGLRQFHVRGLRKVKVEMLRTCLTYNLQQWTRLRKVPTVLARARFRKRRDRKKTKESQATRIKHTNLSHGAKNPLGETFPTLLKCNRSTS